MSPISNTQAAAATIPCTGLLFGFAALMAQNNDEFIMQRPSLTANGTAVRAARWAVAHDTRSSLSRQFGKYNNCNSTERCVGCERICPAEDLLFDLSVRTFGLSALMLEAHQMPNTPLQARVSTFVPGRPGQSDVWTPILCPVTRRLQLVSVNGTRMALLSANGRLKMSIIVPDHASVRLGNIIFGEVWALFTNAPPKHTPASPYPAGV